jgi:hypothetical protein
MTLPNHEEVLSLSVQKQMHAGVARAAPEGRGIGGN